MKKKIFLVTLWSMTLPALAWGDALAVNGICALSGNFGLDVCFDGITPAYVEQSLSTPATSVKMSFVLDPRSISLVPNARVSLLSGIGPTPNPGVGACPNTAFDRTFRLLLVRIASAPDIMYLSGQASGDFCGFKSAPMVPIAADGPSRICLEWGAQQFRLAPGFFRFAVVPADQSCPADLCACSDFEVELSNSKVSTSLVRLGSPQISPFITAPLSPNDSICIDDVVLSWTNGAFSDGFEGGSTATWTNTVSGGSC